MVAGKVWATLLLGLCLWGVDGGPLDLTVLHTNDVHAHFMEFNAFGGRCPDDQAKEGKCYGGFARQVTKVKEVRATEENVLFLNGGDFFQGTVWYTLHRWQIVADLVNQLGVDAMSLGNHEFDDGLAGLFPYLRHLQKTKVVVCNINSSKVAGFGELVTPSVVLEVGGEKIGVIGYLTPETKFLSSAGDLEFEDEVACIKREALRLTDEEGVDKIVAVGHSGFAVDQAIAREVPQVDIVVGGHTNTFLYTGDPPSTELPQGPYPVVIEREDGSRALVVQDFAFGKYMGFLKVHFDSEGRVESWSGNPVLLDGSVTEDPETLAILEPYGAQVQGRVRQTVGRTHVLLRGDRPLCRMSECNMGNFLADASLDYFVEQPTEKGWNSVAIALWNSGGIRASVDERLNGGNVTLEDVLAIAPFGNTMDVVALRGKHLRAVLEYSVREYDVDALDPPGSLLQVSGLRVVFNVSEAPGDRVAAVWARCADCRVPRFLPLDEEAVYQVVMNTYMAKGGDGFALIPENALSNRNTDELDVDIITRYASKSSPITTGLEGRITIISTKSNAAEQESDPQPQTTQAQQQLARAQPETTQPQQLSSEEQTETTQAQQQTSEAQTETTPAQQQTSEAQPETTQAQPQPSEAQPETTQAVTAANPGTRLLGTLKKIPDTIQKSIPFLKPKEKSEDKGTLGDIFGR